jgi:hypothetical protein
MKYEVIECFVTAAFSFFSLGYVFYKTLPNVKKSRGWALVAKDNKQPLWVKISFVIGCIGAIYFIILGIYFIRKYS